MLAPGARAARSAAMGIKHAVLVSLAHVEALHAKAAGRRMQVANITAVLNLANRLMAVKTLVLAPLSVWAEHDFAVRIRARQPMPLQASMLSRSVLAIAAMAETRVPE